MPSPSPSHQYRIYGVLALGFLLLSSCFTETPGPADDAVAEAVPIVANEGEGLWATGAAWSVEPALEIGSNDAGGVYQFGDISGVDVDADGNVYVADQQSQNIRVFDASGVYLRTIGGPGEGPGEFGLNLAGVFVIDDEVLAPDPSQARISRFALDGTLIEIQRVDMAEGIPIRWDTSGGQLVAQRRTPLAPGTPQTSGDPVITLGNTADTISVLALGQSVQITGGIPLIRQFEPEPFWDSSPDGRFVTGLSGDWRFEVHGPDGQLTHVITRAESPEPVTTVARVETQQALRDMYEVQGVPPEVVGNVLDAMEFSDDFPAFASLALGPAGSLWVQRFRSEEERGTHGYEVFVEDMGSRMWEVFDSEGRYLGPVTFPADFQPTGFVADRMYGIARDLLDVQRVQAYRVLMDG